MENGIHPLNGPEHADSYQRLLMRNFNKWRTILPRKILKSNSVNFTTDLVLCSMRVAAQLFYKIVFLHKTAILLGRSS